MKYAWIQEHRDSFPVAAMCRVLQVSKSGYYQSLKRKPSRRAERTSRIHQTVQQLHEQSDGIYGNYKIAEQMQNDAIWKAPAATPWPRR